MEGEDGLTWRLGLFDDLGAEGVEEARPELVLRHELLPAARVADRPARHHNESDGVSECDESNGTCARLPLLSGCACYWWVGGCTAHLKASNNGRKGTTIS